MQRRLENAEAAVIPAPPTIRAIAPTIKVTEAYDAWWEFAYKRQRIYYRRLRGSAAPWTDDSTLSKYRFTNAYRAADRVSQYLIKNVIYSDGFPQDPNEVVFRILLFKFFNRIETWEALTSELGSISLADKPFERIDQILCAKLAAGQKVYSAAYIMPPWRSPKKIGVRKHQTHLALLQLMMADRLGDRLAEAPTMTAGFELLRSYPMIGDFLAYQFITDINYSEVVDFSESEFVAAGPGAREGLRKCFADTGGRTNSDLIRMMMDMQEEEFARLDLDFRDLFGRSLKLVDCQNIFCEVAKYARVRYPRLTPEGGRRRIKQTYRPGGHIPAPFFPPKWGINETVIAQFPTSSKKLTPYLGRYQVQAGRTSIHAPVKGGDAITIPILGLIGEAGEVVSELKKRAREGNAYVAFTNRLGEELGDLLWYVSDVAERRGIRLADFDEPLIAATTKEGASVREGDWIRAALSLAERVGRISGTYEGLLSGNYSRRQFDRELTEALAALIRELATVAQLHGLSLAAVAQNNLAKVTQRWVFPPEQTVIRECIWPESERFPNCFDARLDDNGGRVTVSFSVGGQTIPAIADTLTDNAYDPDGYRFHDVFHLAYAAVLNWSPITRKLLKRKRKSDPRVDEVEDGGRAAAIEEGISALVFTYATQHRMLAGVGSIEDSLLRTIQNMTGHLEVSNRTAAEWQTAIIQGFDVWRRIVDAGGGSVRVDMVGRRISFVEGREQLRLNAENPST